MKKKKGIHIYLPCYWIILTTSMNIRIREYPINFSLSIFAVRSNLPEIQLHFDVILSAALKIFLLIRRVQAFKKILDESINLIGP